MIFKQFLFAGGAIAVTVLVHAVFAVIVRGLRGTAPGQASGDLSGVVQLVVISLWLIAAHCISAAVWAAIYWYTGTSGSVEEALYFALSTYTTLGFGDIVAPVEWRLLTGLSSLNGLLMFGLSAAILVDAAVWLRRAD
ncbi:MAG: ion channel [Pseudomonadota bacterium]